MWVIYAIITENFHPCIKEGMIHVMFENNENVEFNETYVMVESSAFFEACRHVMKSLQGVGQSLPFQKYIVGEKKEESLGIFLSGDDQVVEIERPDYLKEVRLNIKKIKFSQEHFFLDTL